ncbi:MAG: CDP-glycerol glycerophosphotransferase family protein [Gammaproteobacteria bacterium]|jgi:YidC/Oxa1 family membrane protein insertase|nr:CDP-glycerol--glycerophosphate glycerophosphotransferase [Gammaproteobacteria bacterium]MBQ09437.1 CDP-glycerol--glycerophosphate glycerophosphotransferase [Gammaproteobacteria bacterium]MDP6146423.1 CDP-glycerol glycerophosphotransferase family protein [Gammaproteobacteria bacterium]HJL80895.1 CDP-glycerol glycerophosphotransferase family protein [Gammaproteobacteria bacterium]HJM09250.1 CDP-glycerol glycerophosphotransferase family protein [Gammaproteobacteria bacterium]|tara:strand:- start:1750 stop:2880 length:1131 start_codon:yes stop_codon:yes gene_type:complete
MTTFFKGYQGYRTYKKLPKSFKKIVFYSESFQDWHHLKPLLNTLLNQEIDTTYVASDEKDPGLLKQSPNYKSIFIGKGFFRILFFQYLKAKLFILTMMDLNNFELKRSMHSVHYVYIFHSLTSTHMVDTEESFDHYDTILCAGPHQKKEIELREQNKDLNAKNLVSYGYPRLERLIEMNAKPVTHNKVILLAPTWGEQSIINLIGMEICSIIIDHGYSLILRPHHETLKRSPELINEIENQYSHTEKFRLVTEMGDSQSLLQSDLLVCDWSGTAIEYSLGLEKPVIFIDIPPRVRNPNWEEIKSEPLEMSIREKVGRIISPSELEELPSTIDELLNDDQLFSDQIESLREEFVYNLSHSESVGLEEIKKLLKTLKN